MLICDRKGKTEKGDLIFYKNQSKFVVEVNIFNNTLKNKDFKII